MTIPDVLVALDARIARLQQARELISDSALTPAPVVEPAKRRGRPPGVARSVEMKPAGKRTMSEEGRARIAAAQKKRWAKSKKAAKVAASSLAVKKTLATKATVAPKQAAPAKAAATKVVDPAKKTAVLKKAGGPAQTSSSGGTPRSAEKAEPANRTISPVSAGEANAGE